MNHGGKHLKLCGNTVKFFFMLIDTNVVVECNFEGFLFLFLFLFYFYIFINLILLESVVPEVQNLIFKLCDFLINSPCWPSLIV